MAPLPWEFMREWWDVLGEFHKIQPTPRPLLASQQSAFRPLILYPPSATYGYAKNEWLARREALELVLLQREVDERTFMETILEVFDRPDPGEIPMCYYRLDAVIPCGVEFLLHSYNDDDDDWSPWLLPSFLEPVALEDRSEQFQDTRIKILALAGEATRRQIMENRWTIPVTVGLFLSSEESLTEALECVVQIKQGMDAVLTPAEDPEEEKRRVALRGFPFRAVAVDVVFSSSTKISIRLSDALELVAKTEGLMLRDADFHAANKPSRETHGSIVRSLTNGGRSDGGSLTLRYRTGERVMTAMELSHFLSALHQSDQFICVKMKHVFQSFTTSERRWIWLWIVHAFFSTTTNHTTTTLQLGLNRVTAGDLATVRSYMKARNPVALLCHPAWRFVSSEDPAIQPRKRVLLSSGIHALTNPSRTRHAEAMPLPFDGRFDVIQANEEFVDVVVPAYGQCRVRTDEVKEWEVLPDIQPTSALNRHSIKSLKLRFHEMDLVEGNRWILNAATLLHLIGEPLQSLDVECATTRSDVFLEEVWAACPNLKKMGIKPTNVPSLDYFVDAYEAGKCHVESLCLKSCLVDDARSRLRLFEALEGPEPRTKLASTLRELSLLDVRSRAMTTDQVKQIADKIQSNQLLRYIRVSLRDIDDKVLLKPLHRQFLRGQSMPLSIRHKCALLSIVTHANDPAYAACVQWVDQLTRFDSSVLSNILAFAAHPVKRSITINPRS